MESESSKIKVFQVDSPIVQKVYKTNDNYLIEYDDTVKTQEYCAIYFCSNNIYYPNTEEIFRKRIIERNSFEWYGTRIKKAWKHIFMRDILKQWYLKGINSRICTPNLLLEFLQRETEGMKIITIGSSAGGYASILYGSQLNAERIIAINPQIEIASLLLPPSSPQINPLLFRLASTGVSKYFDLRNVVDVDRGNIYYFHSTKSKWDNKQYSKVCDYANIHHLSFTTSHHGIPFLKVALPKVINMENEELIKFCGKSNNPYIYTIKMVGVRTTIRGVYNQFRERFLKRK